MDSKVVSFYREIFSDLSVDREEAAELNDFLTNLNPPPDKIKWLRSTAFKIGSEFLSDDDKEANISLLRTINFIVHAIESTCLEPAELDNTAPLDEEALTTFYKELFGDLSVDQEENEDLCTFFRETCPPDADALVPTRALAFKIGCDYLSEDNDKDANVNLFRCINAIVHAYEMSCLLPKAYELKVEESVNMDDMSLSDAVQHLWNVDLNRLEPNEDYVLNVQEGKKPYLKDDLANEPLFTSIDASIWKRPTYAAFNALLDNYIAETGQAEDLSSADRAETWTFLKAIMETGPMQFCQKYCHSKNSDIPTDREEFLNLLHKIWFELYSRQRGGRPDSSGFEHVFVGEVKDGDVSGFHNWMQLAKEENAGRLDYRGYIKPRGNSESESDSNDHLLTIQFRWNGVEKFVGTSFIGVSPEFEMALYTMCFLVGDSESNEVELNTGTDTFGVTIKCFKMGQDKIGTSFPEVSTHYDE